MYQTKKICPICKHSIYFNEGNEKICGECEEDNKQFICYKCNKIIFTKELLITPDGTIKFPCCNSDFNYEDRKHDYKDIANEIMDNQIKYIQKRFAEMLNEINYPPYQPRDIMRDEMKHIFQKFIEVFGGDWIASGIKFDPNDKHWYKSENYRKYNLPREHFGNNEGYIECKCRGNFRFLGYDDPNGESTHYICCTCGKEFWVV